SWHSRVECRVEGGYLGHVRQSRARSVDASDGGGIVQRSEFGQARNLRAHLVVHNHGVAEARSTVYNPVANRVDRRYLLERRRDFLLVTTDVAALPAGVAVLADALALRIQDRPLQAARAHIHD